MPEITHMWPFSSQHRIMSSTRSVIQRILTCDLSAHSTVSWVPQEVWCQRILTCDLSAHSTVSWVPQEVWARGYSLIKIWNPDSGPRFCIPLTTAYKKDLDVQGWIQHIQYKSGCFRVWPKESKSKIRFWSSILLLGISALSQDPVSMLLSLDCQPIRSLTKPSVLHVR